MTVVAQLPALVPPTADDLAGLLPELVLATAFVILMVLDLFTPASRRTWLAAFTSTALIATLAVTLWGWYNVGEGRTVYSGAVAYDRFGLFINVVVVASALAVTLISPDYLNRRGLHYGEYYSLILATTVGMMLLGSASSLMVIFLAIELLSISLYILSGFARRDERSQEAGLKYLLLGGFASGLLLYGMALVYGETGHTQLEPIAGAIAVMSGTDPLLLIGVVLMFVGFAFKISAAPFHTWTPDVYQGAPTSVTMFMSVATKVAAFAALIRVFTYTLPSLHQRWVGMVAAVSVASMLMGNFAALTQTSVKRMLAYSGIAQAGYILIGVAVLDPEGTGTTAALYYLAAYAATNLGAFAVITIMAARGEDLDDYRDLRGLAYRHPYVAALMGLFLLSLGGFPPTAGFFAKFFVFSAALKVGLFSLALMGVVTSAISVFYYLRVALLMYRRPDGAERAYPWSRPSAAGVLVLAASTVGTLVLGIAVTLVLSAATSAQERVIPGSATSSGLTR